MSTRVAFLRAVNLGKRSVRAAQLVDIVEGLGHTDVWTFINSGNVVFDGAGSRSKLESSLGDAFERRLGWECTTFVRTPAELRKALELQPFRVAAGDTYFVTFLKKSLTAAQAKAIEALSNDYDTLVANGRDVHWRMHGLSSASTLKTKQWDEIVGKHCSTSRNTTMLKKLFDKLSA